MAIDLIFDRASREGGSARVRDEERRAWFQGLVRDHLVVLHGLARRLGPSAEDAEDLVQETLLRAWRSARRFRGDADPRTWLYRILLNLARDRWRRDARRMRRPDVARPSPADPADRGTQREAVSRVMEVVRGLPARQRECLLLRVRAGLPHRDIAELLGIRPGVVKLHLVHARRTLNREFRDDLEAWGMEAR